MRKKCKEHLKTIVSVQEEIDGIKKQITDVKEQIKKAHSSQEEIASAMGFPQEEDLLSDDSQRELGQLFRVSGRVPGAGPAVQGEWACPRGWASCSG